MSLLNMENSYTTKSQNSRQAFIIKIFHILNQLIYLAIHNLPYKLV